MLTIMSVVPVGAAGSKVGSSAPVIEFYHATDFLSPLAAKSDSAGGNSDNSNAGGNSGNSNAGGNSDNSNAGGNSDNSNAGGNSDTSNAGGNSGNSNAGGNSDTSNAGGNSDNSNAGGNSGNSNAGGNSDTSNQGEASSLRISGSEITARENSREVTVDVQKAKDAGERVSVKGSVITIAKGPVTIDITTTAVPKETGGKITGGIRSISMEHQPMTARFKDTGTASASFKAELMSLPPPGSTIAAVITEEPGQTVQAAYNRAISGQGYQLDSVAYAMNITKNNLTDGKDIGQATVTMSVNSSWVADHGGIANIRIVRFADDGTSQLLETRFLGPMNSANKVFEGTSPGGLSIFALISVRASPGSVSPESPQETIAPDPTVTVSRPVASAMDPVLLATPFVILGIYLMVRKR